MKLPRCQQEQDYTCAVACLRSVAAYYGIDRTEAELLPLCEATRKGTPPENLANAARQLGLSVRLTFDEPAVLSEAAFNQQPLIVYLELDTPELDIHAVVVTAGTLTSVTFVDPADGLEHTQEHSAFRAAWERAFHTAILLSRS